MTVRELMIRAARLGAHAFSFERNAKSGAFEWSFSIGEDKFAGNVWDTNALAAQRAALMSLDKELDSVSRSTYGADGVRDPDSPCRMFVLGPRSKERSCDGDGHHFCGECVFWSGREG